MKDGFTLIELLMYLVVFSIMIFVAFHFITVTHIRFMDVSRWANEKTHFHTACRAMSYMLQAAPKSIQSWKKITDKELVFHDNNRDVGFAFDKKRLVKKTGTYTQGLGWQSKHTTVLADKIGDFYFSCDILDDVVIGISWELMANHGEKNYTIKQYVCLRNRNII